MSTNTSLVAAYKSDLNIHGVSLFILTQRIKRGLDLDAALATPSRKSTTYPVYVKGQLKRLSMAQMLWMQPEVAGATILRRIKRYGDTIPDWEDISQKKPGPSVPATKPHDRKTKPRPCIRQHYQAYRLVIINGKQYQLWWNGICWSRDGYRASISMLEFNCILGRYPDAVVARI